MKWWKFSWYLTERDLTTNTATYSVLKKINMEHYRVFKMLQMKSDKTSDIQKIRLLFWFSGAVAAQ